jgi:hypothetical protein
MEKRMFKKIIPLGLTLFLLLSGCATAEKSTLLGGVIGSVVGGSIGSLANQGKDSSQRTTGLLVGATAGGALGALLGNQSYKEQEKKRLQSGVTYGAPNLEMFGSGNDKGKGPKLKPAQVRVRYVEDQVKDGVFVPAHFEYEIAKPAHWEKGK